MKIKNTKRRGVEDMIRCPACRAFSYPYKIDGPGYTKEEKEGVYCKSCNINLIPILKQINDKMVELEKERKEKETKAKEEKEMMKEKAEDIKGETE
jgi:Zn-finger protein